MALNVDSEIVRRCYKRMVCWRRLALTTLETEYPSFELCQSFAVLALGNQRKHDIGMATTDLQMRRLGKAFGCNADNLKRQVDIFKPAARAHYVAGIPTLECWRRSLSRETRRKIKQDALRIVLLKYAACSVSTHKIDSDFSIWQQRSRPQQGTE